MCVCVRAGVILFIRDVRHVVYAPAGATQEFSTFLLRCACLNVYREKDSAALPLLYREHEFRVPTK